MFRRRRPLVRGAVIAGGAYAAGEQASSSGGLGPDGIAELEKLAQLRDQGVLTQEEFEAQKAKILAG